MQVRKMKFILLVAGLFALFTNANAQELLAKVTINHNQIQGTDASVFDNLQETLEQFINDRQWTSLQFQKNERIACNFNITVTQYDQSSNLFTCTALIQANRPVYNSAYTSTLYNNQDGEFNFEFAQFDQLNFNEEMVDNQLTALIAYYAYLIIGLNLDSFSPMGGEDVLQRCLNLTNNAQNLNFTGWKAFDNDRNRFAIINDYLDGAMQWPITPTVDAQIYPLPYKHCSKRRTRTSRSACCHRYGQTTKKTSFATYTKAKGLQKKKKQFMKCCFP